MSKRSAVKDSGVGVNIRQLLQSGILWFWSVGPHTSEQSLWPAWGTNTHRQMLTKYIYSHAIFTFTLLLPRHYIFDDEDFWPLCTHET